MERSDSEGDRELVLGWLREFNWEENGEFMRYWDGGGDEDLILVARDEEGGVVGGLVGKVELEWVKVHILAVAPECRGRGVGRLLMAEAERRGKESGCLRASVDTLSFQAPGFYEKLGYGEVGRLVNWDSHGHDKVFYVKGL